MNEAHRLIAIKKLPAVLHFLQECPFVDQFIKQAEIDDAAWYSGERKLRVLADATPLYCQRTKLPPTTTATPGRTIPGGYTPSGKYKPASYSPAKSDKRAGK